MKRVVQIVTKFIFIKVLGLLLFLAVLIMKGGKKEEQKIQRVVELAEEKAPIFEALYSLMGIYYPKEELKGVEEKEVYMNILSSNKEKPNIPSLMYNFTFILYVIVYRKEYLVTLIADPCCHFRLSRNKGNKLIDKPKIIPALSY